MRGILFEFGGAAVYRSSELRVSINRALPPGAGHCWFG